MVRSDLLDSGVCRSARDLTGSLIAAPTEALPSSTWVHPKGLGCQDPNVSEQDGGAPTHVENAASTSP